jgi:hypothetical protein
MDEGKNPNPRIYTVEEVDELKEEVSDFLDQLNSQDGIDHLISRMTTLKSNLDQSISPSKMREASILYNDIHWEYYQFLKKRSFDQKHEESMKRRRQFAEKSIMASLTSDEEDYLIMGMRGGRMPWNCGD